MGGDQEFSLRCMLEIESHQGGDWKCNSGAQGRSWAKDINLGLFRI